MVIEVIEYAAMREYGILGFPSFQDIVDCIQLANERNCVIKLAWRYEGEFQTYKVFMTKYSVAEDIYDSLQREPRQY